jgi:hypothetical protein
MSLAYSKAAGDYIPITLARILRVLLQLQKAALAQPDTRRVVTELNTAAR